MSTGPVLLLGARLAAAVVVERGGARATRYAEALHQPEPLDALLDALLADGPRQLPDLVCVGREGDRLRVLVRGRTAVRLDDETIAAPADIGTWREELRPVPTRVALVVDDEVVGYWAPGGRERVQEASAPRAEEPGGDVVAASGGDVPDAGEPGDARGDADPIGSDDVPPSGATVLTPGDASRADASPLTPLPPPVPAAPATGWGDESPPAASSEPDDLDPLPSPSPAPSPAPQPPAPQPPAPQPP
ncbi:MAG: hypothetical protein JJT89_15690, partial [Nitriliruptoraceae bacterium]|nr:hypothetical protein [Nitriliruptoraceae bacterium]